MDDGTETRLVEEPPAPQPGDIVYYQDFLEILVETVEERWLTGAPPDISSPADIGDLRAALNQQVVALASEVQRVGEEIEADEVQEETVEDVENEVTEIETLLQQLRKGSDE
jgi:hypothetical protein